MLIFVDILKELMRRNKKFEETCYQLSFPTFINSLAENSSKLKHALRDLKNAE